MTVTLINFSAIYKLHNVKSLYGQAMCGYFSSHGITACSCTRSRFKCMFFYLIVKIYYCYSYTHTNVFACYD